LPGLKFVSAAISASFGQLRENFGGNFGEAAFEANDGDREHVDLGDFVEDVGVDGLFEALRVVEHGVNETLP
jgi:hypothetical protein